MAYTHTHTPLASSNSLSLKVQYMKYYNKRTGWRVLPLTASGGERGKVPPPTIGYQGRRWPLPCEPVTSSEPSPVTSHRTSGWGEGPPTRTHSSWTHHHYTRPSYLPHTRVKVYTSNGISGPLAYFKRHHLPELRGTNLKILGL